MIWSPDRQIWTPRLRRGIVPIMARKAPLMFTPVVAAAAANDYLVPWGVTAFWELEEASGTRVDAHGANDLTDTNTVTSATGLVGTSALFTLANSEYLTIADNTDLSTGDIDFWVAGWFYLESVAGAYTMASKYQGAGNQKEYIVDYLHATERFRMVVSNNGTDDVVVSSVNTTSPAGFTWHFVLAWHDSVNNTINIRINNNTLDSASHATGVFDGSAPFRLGAVTDGNYLDGRLDQVCFGKNPPGGIAGIIGEIHDVLYNGGAGVTYADIS